MAWKDKEGNVFETVREAAQYECDRSKFCRDCRLLHLPVTVCPSKETWLNDLDDMVVEKLGLVPFDDMALCFLERYKLYQHENILMAQTQIDKEKDIWAVAFADANNRFEILHMFENNGKLSAEEAKSAITKWLSERQERKTNMNDNVNSPSHYTQGSIECIEAIKASMTPAEYEGYLKGNIIKYTWRWRNKGGVESLCKGRWYLNRLIESQEVSREELD